MKNRNYGYQIWTSIIIAIAPLIGCGIGQLCQQATQIRKLQQEAPRMEQIDRDNLTDLIVGDRIFLADQIDKGLKFRELENFDRYRIQ